MNIFVRAEKIFRYLTKLLGLRIYYFHDCYLCIFGSSRVLSASIIFLASLGMLVCCLLVSLRFFHPFLQAEYREEIYMN
jgi:hypothetical protein